MWQAMLKEALYSSVVQTLFRLEIEKGHLKWTMTDLSRYSNVSRPLLYYHFGSDKEKILSDGLSLISEEVFGLSKTIFSDPLTESLLRAKKTSEACPWISQFYLKWRNSTSEIGEKLRQYEADYDRRIGQTFPHFSKETREALFAIFFGLFSFPGLSDQAVESAVRIIEKSTAPNLS